MVKFRQIMSHLSFFVRLNDQNAMYNIVDTLSPMCGTFHNYDQNGDSKVNVIRTRSQSYKDITA